MTGHMDLKGKSILFVGGRNRNTGELRDLIEEHNGRFDYHDGGMEESLERLSNLLNRADAVIFPVKYVSHSALHRVKQACKRMDKPYFPLRQTGLAAITSALAEYVGQA